MVTKKKMTLAGKIKNIFIGRPRDLKDKSLFHNISLIAFFAWVGLGADGISSSCYGPAEAFIALGKHHYLGILIALASAVTIFIISESYSQIIELFPSGGGGYIVASRLLSPMAGMLSGSALLVDYVLTISISIASGADAIFSFLPPFLFPYKLWFALATIIFLIVLNLRGVKESVIALMPIFLVFIATHLFVIIFSIVSHYSNFPEIIRGTAYDIKSTSQELGMMGMFLLLLRAYSMGAGTYTGIEAVSNGLPILREPKVKTAKKTMTYMFISLASIVFGLMISYVFYRVEFVPQKTMNAVLFETISMNWGHWGFIFVLTTLVSEAAILFVAAQTGFLDGPRVLANMAMDRWIPKRFALLSDRLVNQNGILIMGAAAIIFMMITKGSVAFLVILYSINVFITFTLSQLGMVRHWLTTKEKLFPRLKKLSINGIGLILCAGILISVVLIKFHEGGWMTIAITGGIILLGVIIRRNYAALDKLLGKLDRIVDEVESIHPVPGIPIIKSNGPFDQKEKTAVLVVKDFTGVGLKTLLGVFKSFGPIFKNIIFVQIGLINAGVFKGTGEFDKVENKVKRELDRYISLMQRHGYHAEGISLTGIDVVEELAKTAPKIISKFPNSIFFGGQVVFPKDSILSRILHNYTLFSMQKRLYNDGIPIVILPVETK